MRSANVFYKRELAGKLTQNNDGSFSFQYNSKWIADSRKPAISLTLPKTNQTFRSNYLFPFFYNLIPEGGNRTILCHQLRIEEDDYFSLLLSVATHDTIGAVTLKSTTV